MPVMSRDEREAFLAQPHVGVLAVSVPDRAPLAAPIWYSYRPGGDISIITHPDSRKAKALQEAGRATLVVQQERLPYKFVSVEGPVIDTYVCDIEADVRPMAHRYLGTASGDQYVDSGDDSESVVIVFRPERWNSTDYGKTD